MKVQYSFIFLLGFTLLFCSSTPKKMATRKELIGKKIPLMILEDTVGNKFSTAIFLQKENAIVHIRKDEKKLKSLISQKSEVYSWIILDRREKPWYIPSFWYNRNVPEIKFLFIETGSGLLNTLKIPSREMDIILQNGQIQEIKKP